MTEVVFPFSETLARFLRTQTPLPSRRAGAPITRFVLWKSAFRIPQGKRVAPARRTKLGEDGNQMPADGNSFPDVYKRQALPNENWALGGCGDK